VLDFRASHLKHTKNLHTQEKISPSAVFCVACRHLTPSQSKKAP